MKETNQFSLLKTKRFLPYFLTQALGAFNDNLFKNALLLMVAFSAIYSQEQRALLTNVAAGLFIFPFFFLSPLGGQIADKMEKSRLIRIIKLIEIALMCFAGVALWFESTPLLLAFLFLMGAQSAFFGPVKFALLPQHLKPTEIIGGNALIEMGTFLAILLGTIAAGILFDFTEPMRLVAIAVILFSLLGYISSRYIPAAPSCNPSLKINWNPFTSLSQTVKAVKPNKTLFQSILAISWFWFLGASYLTQLPIYARDYLGGNPQLVTLLLTVFSVGIAVGSLLCEWLSDNKVELGIIPFGSIGMSIFGIDLYFASQNINPEHGADLIAFISEPQHWRLLIDLAMISLFGGMYVVPLNALIQVKSDDENRARVIAANNVFNALFMVLSAILAIVLLTVLEFTIPQLFLVLAIGNIFVAGYIYSQVPEFAFRFIIWILSHTIYRVKHRGLQNIPETGPVVLVCNHVSYMDSLLIAGACRRPVRFVMDKGISELPLLKYVFRGVKAIPICAEHKDPTTFRAAFDKISEELADDQVVCIFPEGKLTKTGEINTFKRGIELIIKRNPAPVIPMALNGLWGSFFSHQGGIAFSTLPKRFWSRVTLSATQAIPAHEVTAEKLQQQVTQLLTES